MARLDELERKFEENPRRYFAPLANEYRKAGDAQRAAGLCRSQLPDVPGHISGHIVLGQALFDARDFDGSRAALETALALDPENIVALRYLGDIARETGDVAGAERWYSRTLEADPYNEAATTALELLRAAPLPAGEPVSESVSESEPHPATDLYPAGFEPTSHVEPDPAEPADFPIHDEQQLAEAAEPSPPAAQESSEPPAVLEPAATAEAERASPEAELESSTSAVLSVTGEFAGDLSVSTEPETAEPETAKPEIDETAPSAESTAPAIDELSAAATIESSIAEPPGPLESMEPPVEELSTASEATDAPSEAPPLPEPAAEQSDVAAGTQSELEIVEEAIRAEERVLESAAPFVTETMADLYLEQGYPHEALELLLQLSEQRPQDDQLRAKIEQIESTIALRRDAAVAAARAERTETAEAAPVSEQEVPPASEPEAAYPEPAVESPVEPDPPISVRELFARMDAARPRAAGTVTPRPISRRRSDFVPLPEGESAAGEAADDPFAFPNTSPPVPRTSGPHQTFNPSTAAPDEFNAWLRGLRGP